MIKNTLSLVELPTRIIDALWEQAYARVEATGDRPTDDEEKIATESMARREKQIEAVEAMRDIASETKRYYVYGMDWNWKVFGLHY